MAENIWQTATFLSYVQTVTSNSRTAGIQTDAGAAYLKAINNPGGRRDSQLSLRAIAG
jgi:hypothetical protein